MVATANRVAAQINGNGKHSSNGKHVIENKQAAPPPLEPVSDGKEGQRTPNGQFAAGNKCGRGNPHARKLAAMRKAFAEAVDENRLKELAEKLYQRSLYGDMVAAKLILSYVVGKPVEAVDPDRLDLEEWKLIEQSPTHGELLALTGTTVRPAVAAEAVGAGQPTSVLEHAKHILKLIGEKGLAAEDLVIYQNAVADHRHHRKPR